MGISRPIGLTLQTLVGAGDLLGAGTLVDGALAVWNFDGDVGSTTIADATGNGVTGTATSTAIRTASGISGNALIGDGTNFVNLGTASDLLNIQATSEYTVAFWVNIATADFANLTRVLDLGYNQDNVVLSNNTGLVFQIVGNGILLQRLDQGVGSASGYNGGGYGSWRSSITLAPDVWNLVVMSRSLTKGFYHVYNSTEIVSEDITHAGNALTSWAADENHIMALEASTSVLPTASGHRLDTVGVWNRVLTQAERNKLWSSGVGYHLSASDFA